MFDAQNLQHDTIRCDVIRYNILYCPLNFNCGFMGMDPLAQQCWNKTCSCMSDILLSILIFQIWKFYIQCICIYLICEVKDPWGNHIIVRIITTVHEQIFHVCFFYKAQFVTVNVFCKNIVIEFRINKVTASPECSPPIQPCLWEIWFI